MRTTSRHLVPRLCGLAALVAPGPAAAQRSHIGAHVGYDFDRDLAVVGGQLSLPLNYVVELYPSVDVYLGEPAGESLVGFSVDLKLRLNPGAPLQLYVGGGVNALRASAGGGHTTDTGWD